MQGESQGGHMSSSMTVPSIRQGASVSFLSRMWGAATKSQGQDKERGFVGGHHGVHSKARLGHVPIVEIVEPAEVSGYHSNTFRRIVHSRSTVFCGGEA